MTEMQQGCCEMLPENDDIVIDGTYTPDSIWAYVQINCTPDTGVYFFRYEGQFYMRKVTPKAPV